MDKYKIALIYGDDFINKGKEDGEIDYCGEIDSDSLHVVSLLNYAKENFPEIQVFQQLSIRHQPEVVAYFLTQLGIIVFFNMTKYDDTHIKRYGRNGMFMMPDQLTPKQTESLKEFSKSINDFKCLINYDLTIDSGILDSKIIQSLNHETSNEIVDIYLERKKENQNTK